MNPDSIDAKINEFKHRFIVAEQAEAYRTKLAALNDYFGGSQYISTYLMTRVRIMAEHLDITLVDEDTLARLIESMSKHALVSYSPADIKMLGDFIEYNLHGLVKYDSKTFSFYCKDTLSPYETYIADVKYWKSLSWWKRYKYRDCAPVLNYKYPFDASYAS